MRARVTLSALLFGALGLVGCKTSSPSADEATTSPPETTQAAAPDTTPEAAPDATPDAAPTPAPVFDPQWWRDAVGYEIFVRSFQDSNGDGIGDLNGITQRLDHLSMLGVDLVWLMPIHPSPSYHGYDVIDYRDVNPEYGTLADLDALVATAKARGIHIIIDLLLNHSSDKNPWFLQSRKGPTFPDGSPNDKADWYVWRDTAPAASEGWARPWDGASLWHELNQGGTSRWYYGLFWGGMPDLNIANPAVQREMEDIMAFWVGHGLSGFRIDAIRYLIEGKDAQTADTAETHAYLKGLRKRTDERFPGTLLLGEAWTSAEDQAGYYGDGDELDMAFSFDMAAALVETSRDGVRSRLSQIMQRSSEIFARDRGFEAPFLTNHDMARVAREMMRSPTAQPVPGTESWQTLRVAAALMLASPGTPFLYYGEEIGMVGGAAREDQNKRTPMHWVPGDKGGFTTGEPWWPMTDEAPGIDVATQQADKASLMNLYARLVKARKSHIALRRGDQQRLDVRGGKGVIAFLRTAPSGERALVVANVDREAVPAFDVPGITTAPGAKATIITAEGLDGAVSRTDDGSAIIIPGLAARSFAWIAIE